MRHHKDWLQAYLGYTQNSEAPEIFHLWTGLSVIGGALRRKCFIDQGNFAWHSNMYLFFVAPPGIVSKSTTADVGVSLLRQVEGINFGPSIITWQAIVTALENAQEEYYNERGEAAMMSCLTVLASELGTFFDPKNREQVDLLVSLWDCRNIPLEKMTKGGGLERIEQPWLNLIGCTTPSWVSENLNNYFSGGGFSSRTLYVYAEAKRQFIAYPGQKSAADKALEKTLVEDLYRISQINGPYNLSPEAITFGSDWYKHLYLDDHPFKHDQRFQHYLARKQAHVHKAAMLRAASLRDERMITLSDLQWAIKQIDRLEPSMVKAFGGIASEEVVAVQVKLLGIIRDLGKIRKQELYQEVMFSVGYDTYNKAIEGLLGSGLVELRSNGADNFFTFVGQAIVDRLESSGG